MTHHDKARNLAATLRVLAALFEQGLEFKSLDAFLEAADLITALAEENRRLRGVLEKIASTGRCEFAEVRAALSSGEASRD